MLITLKLRTAITLINDIWGYNSLAGCYWIVIYFIHANNSFANKAWMSSSLKQVYGTFLISYFKIIAALNFFNLDRSIVINFISRRNQCYQNYHLSLLQTRVDAKCNYIIGIVIRSPICIIFPFNNRSITSLSKIWHKTNKSFAIKSWINIIK